MSQARQASKLTVEQEPYLMVRSLADLIAGNDDQIRQQIAFWDAGSPAYQWIDLISRRLQAATPTTNPATIASTTQPWCTISG